jgi:uncharacterized protein YjbJ (UPF0337 family)
MNSDRTAGQWKQIKGSIKENQGQHQGEVGQAHGR